MKLVRGTNLLKQKTNDKLPVCSFPKKEIRKAENTFICINKQRDFVMAFTLQIRQKKLFGKTVLDVLYFELTTKNKNGEENVYQLQMSLTEITKNAGD